MADLKSTPSASATAFVHGLGDPWRGVVFLLRNASLWPWATLPFVLSLAVYILIFALGWHYGHGWFESTFYGQGKTWAALGMLIEIIFWILAALLAAFAFIPVATLIANPFNDLLSERTEWIYRGEQAVAFSFSRMFRALWVGLVGEIRRFIKVIVLLLLAYALLLIPVAGAFLSSAASMMITLSFLSLEYTSFSMDRRIYTWEQKKEFLRNHRARTWGFSAMTLAILTIPIVNALFIPISAIAGTLLFCDTELTARRK